MVLNPTVLIPTPLLLWIGRMVGVVLLIPKVFFRIVTWESPRLYFRSTSSITFLVFPSRTLSWGADEYPLPPEVIPINSNDANASISTNWGNSTVGLKVVSEGKLYPILLISVFLTCPIDVLTLSIIAPLPTAVVIVVIPGSE